MPKKEIYTYTLAEVARSLDVSATNVKYYIEKLGDRVDYTGEGRTRRFSQKGFDLLTKVRDEVASGKKLADIIAKLKKTAPTKTVKAKAAPIKVTGKTKEVPPTLDYTPLLKEILKLVKQLNAQKSQEAKFPSNGVVNGTMKETVAVN